MDEVMHLNNYNMVHLRTVPSTSDSPVLYTVTCDATLRIFIQATIPQTFLYLVGTWRRANDCSSELVKPQRSEITKTALYMRWWM